MTFDAVRDVVWKLWPQLPTPEKIRFLRRLRLFYDVHRFRTPPMNEALVARAEELGAVRYDLTRGELWRGREPIRLTATEAMLMRIFAAHPHEPVTRIELVENLGGGDAQSQERAVDVQITRLRRKIETDPKVPRYLQTVRGSGYMLAPD